MIDVPICGTTRGTAVSRMPKAESLRNIEPPDDNDWVEILTNFNLSEKRAKLLRQGVVEIAADLNRHIAFERRALQGRDRKETIKHLRRVSKPDGPPVPDDGSALCPSGPGLSGKGHPGS